MPDTFIRWPVALSEMECEQSGETRRDLLLQAKDRLERVTWHDRWDCSARDYAWQASELLRRAGMHELADEVSDEFGIDTASVLAEIEREIGR